MRAEEWLLRRYGVEIRVSRTIREKAKRLHTATTTTPRSLRSKRPRGSGEAMNTARDNIRLRILHLEDDSNDAELIQAALESEGLAVAIHRVDTREEFTAALTGPPFDLILSDYALPGFDGLSALRLARETVPA